MLKRIRLHNFRTYLNAEFLFEPRHLVIGKNNSGKSNLCRGLRFFGGTASGDLAQAAGLLIPGGVGEICNWKLPTSPIECMLECELPYDGEHLTFEYGLTLEIGAAPMGGVPGTLGLRATMERLVVRGKQFQDLTLIANDGREARLVDERHLKSGQANAHTTIPAPNDATALSRLQESEANPRAILFRRYLACWNYFALSPEHMRFGWRDANPGRFLSPRGDNLAVSIFHLKNQDERRYRRLLHRVAAVEPGLEAVNFFVAPDQGIVPFVSLRHRERASWVGMSDGTLRALGLSCIIEEADLISSQPGWPPPLIIVEEPENGIYGGLLRKLLEDFDNFAPSAQFIYTSHSPFFIDLFDAFPRSVTLLKREGDRTVIEYPPPVTKMLPPADRTTLAERYFAETT